MSLTGALFTGVTGLNAQTQSMAMISDNIANVSTVGFKRTVARFSTLVTDAGTANSFSPGGVRSQPFTQVDTQGIVSTTLSDTDIAISGKGFFVTNTLRTGLGDTLYTRAGSFTPDSVGDLRNTAGLFLRGWPLDVNGNLPAALGDLSSLQTVNVESISGRASATTTANVGTNLDATQAVFGGAYVAGNMATENAVPGTGVVPHFFRTFVVFDALGTSHQLTTAYLKTGINTWAVETYATNAADVNAIAHPNGLIDSGTIFFNGDGTLDADNGGTTLGTFNATTGALTSNTAIQWTNGANNSAIAIDWGTNNLADGLTQFATNFNVAFINQNGATVGQLNGVGIDEDGFVVATFTNGETQALFKVPIATFADPNSLESEDGNAYSETQDSGTFNLREAKTGGAGVVVPSALENSNADIATEFTDMIVTQRAFSANTKVITTVDEMLEELIRSKR